MRFDTSNYNPLYILALFATSPIACDEKIILRIILLILLVIHDNSDDTIVLTK